jgi:protein-S-isoprenylcysteine O-methyltransferase Ste14
MKRFLITEVVNGLVITIRALVAATVLMHADLAGSFNLGHVFGLVELLSLVQHHLNSEKARLVFACPSGWCVGLLYCAAGAVVPSGHGMPTWLTVAMWAWIVVEAWLRVASWTSYSAATPTWVRLRDRGPFAIVRHPMAAWAIVLRLLFIVAYPTWWNLYAVLLGVALIGLHTWSEELFLSTIDEWREYAQRVRWRFAPGIF